MDCPRDKFKLETVDVKSCNLFYCNKCEGYLIKPINQHIVMDLIKHNVCKTSEIKCPDCCKTMKFTVLQSMEIDVCDSCNTIWLDKNEIYKLQNTYSKNELYKGKNKLLETIIEIFASLN